MPLQSVKAHMETGSLETPEILLLVHKLLKPIMNNRSETKCTVKVLHVFIDI